MDEEEMERILKARRNVENGRIECKINMIRSICDFEFKSN